MKTNDTTKYLFNLVACTLLFSSCAFQGEMADLIIHNARIYTVDPEFHVYEAMAIRDGKIIDIGAQQMILNKYTATEVIDAEMRPVFPGLIDAHCHFLGYGYTLNEVNLIGTTSFSEVIERVKKHNPTISGEWIIGRGWDQNDWKESYLASLMPAQISEMDTAQLNIPFPDCKVLDELFPNNPVMLTRIDGHAMLVNSFAMRLAGIVPSTSVDGGSVMVQNGNCTGILVDNAMQKIESILPQKTKEEKIRALLNAQEKCFEVGLTTVSDAGLMKQDIDVIKELHQSGKLKMRMYAMLSDSAPNFEYYLSNGIDTSDRRLTVRAFKFYADGALGSRGACLLNPYADIFLDLGKKEYGMMLSSKEHFREKFEDLSSAGFQVCTHAIGDSANRVILALYGAVLGGVNDYRWRIEHAQVVDPADMSKFAEFSIIPSVQPTHATSDMPWAWKRVGRNRVRYTYAYNDLKSQLGIIALGTDFPVENISPFGTFYAAVMRTNSSGEPEGGFQKENALTREEALMGMTTWAAMSNFEDHFKGSLQKGMVADFVILDRDIITTDPENILKTNVIYTFVNGELVYSRD